MHKTLTPPALGNPSGVQTSIHASRGFRCAPPPAIHGEPLWGSFPEMTFGCCSNTRSHRLSPLTPRPGESKLTQVADVSVPEAETNGLSADEWFFAVSADNETTESKRRAEFSYNG